MIVPPTPAPMMATLRGRSLVLERDATRAAVDSDEEEGIVLSRGEWRVGGRRRRVDGVEGSRRSPAASLPSDPVRDAASDGRAPLDCLRQSDPRELASDASTLEKRACPAPERGHLALPRRAPGRERWCGDLRGTQGTS